ncbi:6-phosphogluconolactonase [Simiduia curdlanivorans]|uniref:6-phosphogluconolactonase n=1 Tax=Simiduia curdlanivorans TaxID=1492769 RepID=A0ABV8V500_9GAMM|nr:6-phosphogluconolactonase [Simiduia curdlanivorans]MDN3639296.1 6-phosphogluconolactonase [Simiduia curdlanivorans]
MIKEYFFESKQALQAQLEQDLLAQVDLALASAGKASLLLSGGSTPGPVYEALGKVLDPRVQVALVDDRWVALDHKGSNEALLRNCFPAQQVIGMKTPDAKPQAAVAAVNQAYQQLHQPFAITVLGMGPDGHTASLFPNAEGLDAALAETAPNCVAITAKQSAVTGELVDRMTLSLNGILNSKKLILLITGDDKLAVYQQAKTVNNISDMPVAAVLQQQQVDLDVYWAK